MNTPKSGGLGHDVAMTYQDFLTTKTRRFSGLGFETDLATLPSGLFTWQKKIVQWATSKGRAAIWADTGLGKTAMQLAWADQVTRYTGKPVLILTPLAVSYQTVSEAAKFGLAARVCAEHGEAAVLSVTNYHKLHRFDAEGFGGVVLDESSILKSFQGKTKALLTETFASTPYRLACTATPAPNDVLELGNHSDFLGIMPQKEMLARWFLNDLMGNMSWRLKGHAKKDFWRWVASWAVVIRKPSDLGYSDDGYILPPLNIHHVTVPTTGVKVEGALFADASLSATTLHDVLRQTAPYRAKKACEIALGDPESWLLWTHTNYEADEMSRLIGHLPNVVEVRGSDDDRHKEMAAEWFLGKRCICGGSEWRAADTSKNTIKRTKKSDLSKRSIIKRTTGQNGTNTCASTSRKTATESLACDELMPIDEMPEGESSTRQTQSCGSNISSTPSNGKKRIQNGDSLNDSSYTVSRQSSTETSSQSKTEDVQFAGSNDPGIRASELSQGQEDCTLTTAIHRGKSEACFAQTVILPLENSEMIQEESKEPCCTCGHLNGNRIMLSKPSIFGYGLNFQHCHKMIFIGLNYSYEQFYQAVRRCYRFGQQSPVDVHVLSTDMEWRLFDSMAKKQRGHEEMQSEMIDLMKEEYACLNCA